MGVIRLRLGEGDVLLQRLLQHGIALAHECGGTLACGSCCVIVRQGLEHLDPASDDEIDVLDRISAFAGSRLACQAVGSGGDVLIEIPRARAPQIPAPLSGNALPVSLSERAAKHFAAQLVRHPGAVAVRLSVRPSGCSGFGYRVEHADAVRDGDRVFESRGIRIAVDPASLPHVQGTTLDVVVEGLARRLRFDNPNARQTCGCGESFQT